MTLSATDIITALEGLLSGQYVHTEEETDFSGCYELCHLPDGSIAYNGIEDTVKCGTTPPVLHGKVETAGLTVPYSNDGTDDGYENEIYLLTADGEKTNVNDIEIEGLDTVVIPNTLKEAVTNTVSIITDNSSASWLKEAFEAVFQKIFFREDTWDIVPDEYDGEDNYADIDDCNLVEEVNEGQCVYNGVNYFIVSYDVDLDDIDCNDDTEERWAYAVAEGTILENNGYYDTVKLLRLSDDDEVIEIRDTGLRYDSVEQEVEVDDDDYDDF